MENFLIGFIKRAETVAELKNPVDDQKEKRDKLDKSRWRERIGAGAGAYAGAYLGRIPGMLQNEFLGKGEELTGHKEALKMFEQFKDEDMIRKVKETIKNIENANKNKWLHYGLPVAMAAGGGLLGYKGVQALKNRSVKKMENKDE